MKEADLPIEISIQGSIYRKVERLGKGGNSVVWGYGDDSGLKYAVKFLVSKKSEAVSRFENEIALHGEYDLVNQGILPMLESGFVNVTAEDGSIIKWRYLVMPIADCLGKRRRPFEVKEAIEIVLSCAETLKSLSQKGIFHRDVKLDNLFYHENKWKVGDFGLVSTPDNRRKLTGFKIGAMYYSAPEMVIAANQDEGYTEKADVFSLAKVLWMLLVADNYDYPMPGHQSKDSPYSQLKIIREDSKIFRFIDIVIDLATKNNVAERWGWDDFISNLRTLASFGDEDSPVSKSSNLENLMNQFNLQEFPLQEKRNNVVAARNSAASEIKAIVGKWNDYIKGDDSFQKFKMRDGVDYILRGLNDLNFHPSRISAQCGFQLRSGEGKNQLFLRGGFALVLSEDNKWFFCEAVFIAIPPFLGPFSKVEIIHQNTYPIDLDTPDSEKYISKSMSSLKDWIPKGMERMLGA